MKALYAALAALVFSATVSKASATTPVRHETVLVMRVAGGMPAPGGPRLLEVKVTKLGVVFVHQEINPGFNDWNTGRGTTKDFRLATLQSQELLKSINNLSSGIKGGELEKQDPNSSDCYDAPNTYFFVVKDGKEVEIASTRACNAYRLKDDSQLQAASTLTNYLESLRGLIAF